jgi:hypothetical protein
MATGGRRDLAWVFNELPDMTTSADTRWSGAHTSGVLVSEALE